MNGIKSQIRVLISTPKTVLWGSDLRFNMDQNFAVIRKKYRKAFPFVSEETALVSGFAAKKSPIMCSDIFSFSPTPVDAMVCWEVLSRPLP